MLSSPSPSPDPQQPLSQHNMSPRLSSSPRSSTHSPTQQETSQQHIPATSRDTAPLASSKPSTPLSCNTQSHPIAPSASTASAAVTIGSTLSATAPHFRTRLIDAPIDLAGLGQPTDGNAPLLQKATMESSRGNVLDFSNGFAPFSDGQTPTQESFPPFHTPSLDGPSPLLSSALFSPDLSSQRSGSVSGGSQSSLDDALRTPNVYINGLPPNFPEDKLLEMTSPFGEVVSVRTFTRHVSDKPSGYGFVLFGSVEAAGRCIESLRKYRNLHPSFSKQVHKIPGTAYANSVALPASATEPPDSFKARMERLKDKSSTNLYMEGLPLSIDPPTLQALIAPYKIMSSRLFQTRLSNPPRIIAFVRLESRQAAEEIIERLHGRMVRGMHDAGSRISVRFADTAEQRELRRVERVNRDDENSPARLTMAQAALLNLQGTQLAPDSQMSRIPSPNFGLSLPLQANLALPSIPYLQPTVSSSIGLHNQQPLEYSALHNLHTHHNDGFNSQAADYVSAGLRVPSHMLDANEGLSHEMLQMQMAMGGVGAGATRAQDGFTTMERLLLQAHEQQQRGATRSNQAQQQAFTPDFNVSAADFHPNDARLGGLQMPSASVPREGGRRIVSVLPTMSEEDFHATGGGLSSVMSPIINSGFSVASSSQEDQHASRLSMDLDSRLTFTRQRNQTHAEARAQAQADAQAQALHTRSTTVPSHYFTSDRSNTQTLLNTRSINGGTHTMNNGSADKHSLSSLDPTVRDTTQVRTTRLHNNPPHGPNGAEARNRNTLTGTTLRNNNIHLVRDTSAPSLPPTKTRANSASGNQLQTRIDTALQNQNRKAHTLARTALSRDVDDEDDGSGLDSPALSYSASVRTPASLSPATPFSAFGETFEGPMIANVAGQGGNEVGLGMGGLVVGSNVKQKMRAVE